MLELQVERIRQSCLIDRVIIATTDRAADDPIEALTDRINCLCFRGDMDDVLGRVVGALVSNDVELHVEFQGDNPMPDALLVDSIIGYYLKHAQSLDYVTNALRTTYPPGAEVSVYPTSVLIDAERHARESPLREHVGLHIFQHPERYRIFNMEAPAWLTRPNLHLEVDTQEDFDVVSALFERFYPANHGFSLSQVVEFADSHKELTARNAGVARRWSEFRKSD